MSAAVSDCIVTLAGVVGAISRHPADFLVFRGLVEQVRQNRRIANVASGDLDGPNLQRLLVDPKVNLEPDPPLGTTVLVRIPIAVSLDLDAGAVCQQVQWPFGTAEDRTKLSV